MTTDAVQIVEAGAVRITLQPPTIGKAIEQELLEKRFPVGDTEDPAQQAWRVLLYLTLYTVTVEGSTLRLPNTTDDERSFARKLAAFQALPLALAHQWRDAADRVAAKHTGRHLLPSAALTDDERESRPLRRARADAERKLRQELAETAAAELGKKSSKPAAKRREFVFYGDMDERLQDWSVLKHYKVLPRAGGWYDQDAEWRHDIMVISNLYAEEYNRLAK